MSGSPDDDAGSKPRFGSGTRSADPQDTASVALPRGFELHEFVVDSVIGEGGFSIVYRALDRRLNRTVAIKEYLPAGLASRTRDLSIAVLSEKHRQTFGLGLRSFVNEAQLLAQFDNPAFVRVLQFWEERGTAYMVMPYYEGQTVKAWRTAMSDPPSEARLLSMASRLLDGLQYLHERSCLHRDIAPDNILLLPNGEPLMLDFGAARTVIGDRTQNLTVILKPGYAPLEQYAEMQSVRQGPWSDIYALSAVFYFLVTGKAPAPSVARSIRDELTPARIAGQARFSQPFLAAIDAGLAVRPDQRPQDVASFARLFDRSVSHLTDLPEMFDDEATVILAPSGESALRALMNTSGSGSSTPQSPRTFGTPPSMAPRTLGATPRPATAGGSRPSRTSGAGVAAVTAPAVKVRALDPPGADETLYAAAGKAPADASSDDDTLTSSGLPRAVPSPVAAAPRVAEPGAIRAGSGAAAATVGQVANRVSDYQAAAAQRAHAAGQRILDPKLLIRATAAALAVCVIGFGLSAYHARSVKREQVLAQQRAELAHLESDVAAAMQRLDEERIGLAQAAAAAAGDAQQLETQLATLAPGADRVAVRAALVEARDKSAAATEVNARFQTALLGTSGLATLRDNLTVAERGAKDNPAQAQPQFAALLQAVQALAATPDETRRDLQQQRSAQLGRLEGNWSDKDCANPSTWHIRDGERLQVDWPGVGTLEERILRVANGRVTTLSVSPEKYKGHMYEYRAGGDVIEAHADGSTAVTSFKKCG